MGNLYQAKLQRLEEAITFYRQAADIYVELRDTCSEGAARSNIAAALRKLKRYDEARLEIEQAIECDSQVGHAAEPWKSFDILCDIETATGKREAARAAWQQARAAYLAYRQQGGYAQYPGGKLVDQVLALLAQEKHAEVEASLKQLGEDPNTPDFLKQLLPAVTTILNGSRDPALADDPALDFDDAAEILFLIERLEND